MVQVYLIRIYVADSKSKKKKRKKEEAFANLLVKIEQVTYEQVVAGIGTPVTLNFRRAILRWTVLALSGPTILIEIACAVPYPSEIEHDSKTVEALYLFFFQRLFSFFYINGERESGNSSNFYEATAVTKVQFSQRRTAIFMICKEKRIEFF